MKLADDTLITTALLRRFQAEAEMEGGNGQHYALLRLESGNLMSHHPYSPGLAPEQIMWADDVLKLLNRELHHDGAWVVVFTHPKPMAKSSIFADAGHAEFGRYVLMWLDADGDVQIPVEWTAGDGDLLDFTDVLIAGKEAIAQSCEAAWGMWSVSRQALDLREGQTFKRALGQRASSAVH